jgi:hypothetical protein
MMWPSGLIERGSTLYETVSAAGEVRRALECVEATGQRSGVDGITSGWCREANEWPVAMSREIIGIAAYGKPHLRIRRMGNRPA